MKYQAAQLLILHGEMDGEPVKFLVDSGASTCFVDEGLVKKHGWRTRHKASPDYIQLANGQAQISNHVLEPAFIAIGDYEDEEAFHITRLAGYDAILGKTWLERLNPRVDWRRHQLVFNHHGREIVLLALGSARTRDIRLATARQIPVRLCWCAAAVAVLILLPH